MSMYNFDRNVNPKQANSGKNDNTDIEDVFQIRKELKVERQRARAEQEITK